MPRTYRAPIQIQSMKSGYVLGGSRGRLCGVRKGLTPDDLGDLLELPLLAVLATHRRDGTVLLSPVWHEWRDGGFHVVTGSRGAKTAHLRRDPRAGIVVCEHAPPYRGLELRATARLSPLEDRVIVRRIATRYLGPEAGERYAESGGDDLLIRLEPGNLRAWDFADYFA
jgi:PPOX class probable F420-dependent enzyme